MHASGSSSGRYERVVEPGRPERVLAYRARAAALFATDLSHADLERRFQRIRELRRSVFGAEPAAALFREEEAVTDRRPRAPAGGRAR